MKKSILFFLIAMISFMAGLTVRSSTQARKNAGLISNPSPTPCPEGNEFPNLIEDKYATKFNGARLNLGYDSGVQAVDIPFAIDEAKVTLLTDGESFVDLGDTLYRLDNRRQVKWKYSTAQLMFDYAYVESTNLVYGTAGDNVMFILDAATGKELHSDSRNGSAAYGVAKKYGNDMCLVTDNFVMYREKFSGDKLEPMKDGITCWRGTKELWHLDFPPDAQLVVSGNRILAVTKSRKAIYVQEIIPPQTKSE